MPDYPNQPGPYDAVKGGENPPPVSGAVLGGIEGVKRRMGGAPDETKIATLKEALKYGEAGLDLVIQALHDPAEKVQLAAYSLLKTRTEPSVAQALQDYLPVNYRKLRDFLAAGMWKDADLETVAAMLAVTGREKAGWLRVEDFNRFSSTDLHALDRLWVLYSNGRFGFSVQKQIWIGVGKNYSAFGDRVGWRSSGAWLNYNYLTFTIKAPSGHLPAAHLTWGSLNKGQMWMWYGGTEEDVRWFEVKSLLARRDL